MTLEEEIHVSQQAIAAALEGVHMNIDAVRELTARRKASMIQLNHWLAQAGRPPDENGLVTLRGWGERAAFDQVVKDIYNLFITPLIGEGMQRNFQLLNALITPLPPHRIVIGQERGLLEPRELFWGRPVDFEPSIHVLIFIIWILLFLRLEAPRTSQLIMNSLTKRASDFPPEEPILWILFRPVIRGEEPFLMQTASVTHINTKRQPVLASSPFAPVTRPSRTLLEMQFNGHASSKDLLFSLNPDGTNVVLDEESALVHELTHARHNLRGHGVYPEIVPPILPTSPRTKPGDLLLSDCDLRPTDKRTAKIHQLLEPQHLERVRNEFRGLHEEYLTIVLGRKGENVVRAELGYPPRMSYEYPRKGHFRQADS